MSVVGASAQANICRAFVWSGKYPSGICLVGKCPSGMRLVGEVPVGEESVGEMSVGNVPGNLLFWLKIEQSLVLIRYSLFCFL